MLHSGPARRSHWTSDGKQSPDRPVTQNFSESCADQRSKRRPMRILLARKLFAAQTPVMLLPRAALWRGANGCTPCTGREDNISQCVAPGLSQAHTSQHTAQHTAQHATLSNQRRRQPNSSSLSSSCSSRVLARGHAATAEAASQPAAQEETESSSQAPAGAWPEQQLYNTLTRRKEVFRPRPGQGSAVSMYVCGVTVYSMSHIGAQQ